MNKNQEKVLDFLIRGEDLGGFTRSRSIVFIEFLDYFAESHAVEHDFHPYVVGIFKDWQELNLLEKAEVMNAFIKNEKRK